MGAKEDQESSLIERIALILYGWDADWDTAIECAVFAVEQLWERREDPEAKPVESDWAWCYTVASNEYKKRRSEAQRLERLPDWKGILPSPPDDPGGTAALDCPILDAIRVAASKAFDELNTTYQKALVLRKFVRLKVAAVARELSVEILNAKQILKRARKQWRSLLSKHLGAGTLVRAPGLVPDKERFQKICEAALEDYFCMAYWPALAMHADQVLARLGYNPKHRPRGFSLQKTVELRHSFYEEMKRRGYPSPAVAMVWFGRVVPAEAPHQDDGDA